MSESESETKWYPPHTAPDDTRLLLRCRHAVDDIESLRAGINSGESTVIGKRAWDAFDDWSDKPHWQSECGGPLEIGGSRVVGWMPIPGEPTPDMTAVTIHDGLMLAAQRGELAESEARTVRALDAGEARR